MNKGKENSLEKLRSELNRLIAEHGVNSHIVLQTSQELYCEILEDMIKRSLSKRLPAPA